MDFGGAGDPLIFFGPLRGAANSSHEGPNQTFALGGEFRGGPQACGSVWYATPSAVPWGSSRTPPRIPSNSPSDPPALNRRHPLVISRILPWDPRLPVAIPGELEGIPEEVFGWNGSELNSERIHVRFSRNRRWNSGGWHRPGEAESGGFPRGGSGVPVPRWRAWPGVPVPRWRAWPGVWESESVCRRIPRIR